MTAYYITADVSRGLEAAEERATLPGSARMFAGRAVAVVEADTWQAAAEIGRELIAGCLPAGHKIDGSVSWMPVSDAERIGDAETYQRMGHATWLRYYRLKAGLTQQQLSELSGVNVRQIRRVEIGEAKAGNLTADNFLALARALGVTPWALLGEEGGPHYGV